MVMHYYNFESKLWVTIKIEVTHCKGIKGLISFIGLPPVAQTSFQVQGSFVKFFLLKIIEAPKMDSISDEKSKNEHSRGSSWSEKTFSDKIERKKCSSNPESLCIAMVHCNGDRYQL